MEEKEKEEGENIWRGGSGEDGKGIRGKYINRANRSWCQLDPSGRNV